MTQSQVFLKADLLSRLRALHLAAVMGPADPFRDGFLFALGAVAESLGIHAADVTTPGPEVRVLRDAGLLNIPAIGPGESSLTRRLA